MHLAIDIIVAILLLFFLLVGWRKGFILSVLGFVRIILSYSLAYFSGRYIGYWLGGAIHRPKILTIPLVAILTFILVAMAFQYIMFRLRMQHEDKQEEDEAYSRPILSSVAGSLINLAGGAITLLILFWFLDLFFIGITGYPIPGQKDSYFGKATHRSAYETTHFLLKKGRHPSQVAAISNVISNPAEGIDHLEKVFSAPSIQRLVTDKQFALAMFSGDPAQVEQNASLQSLFQDAATLEELKCLGVLVGDEKKSDIAEKLARIGQNEKIQNSMENIKAKNLLRKEKITILLRDPDFDVILGELVK